MSTLAQLLWMVPIQIYMLKKQLCTESETEKGMFMVGRNLLLLFLLFTTSPSLNPAEED